ncbi:GDSL esterase/lipase [Abeliophyllum distichum]|uniref:GDSL esterase/lipase n=1 Tax=Abeliophyllum distichum TaxID=126358 RepID=A0ABD1UNC2_9LAMI
MEKKTCYIFFCLVSFAVCTEVYGVQRPGEAPLDRDRVKLFVFGDSYADTGNLPSSTTSSWKEPYGITFPGKPSGRFSDGRVLTDYIASFLGIRSPVPYEWKKMEEKWIKNGMNFAHGGTGVFNTLVDQPNMTAQINLFQQLIQKNVYTNSSSIALVSLAGNDYGTYFAKNGSAEGMEAFTKSVVDQLVLNLKRIHGVGVQKVAVTGIVPFGCLPKITSSTSYKQCSETGNNLAKFHNQLLQQNLRRLNNETGASSVFIFLDLYHAFSSALKLKQDHPGNSTFKNGLKPCCLGSCGSVDETGTKKYVVCENPKQSFFWDSIHPSDHGWRAVYSAFKHSLHSLL